MKLAKVAVSVAVIVGAVATGGSWYTGKQIEQRYGELVQKANHSLQQLKMYGVQAELKEVQIERGLFSSAARYNVAVKSGEESYEFKGNDTLYHGPFPLNRLMKGNIVPAMASTESNIAVPENLKAHFNQDTLLTGKSSLSYSETWSGDYKFSPIKAKDLGLDTSEIHYSGEVAKDGSGKGKLVLPTLKAVSEIDGKPTQEIQFTALEYDFSFDKSVEDYAFLGLGKGNAKLKSFTIKDLDSEKSQGGIELDRIEVSDVSSQAENRLNGEQFESKGSLSGKITLGNKETKVDLGKLTLNSWISYDAKLGNELTGYFTSPETLEQNSDQVKVKGLELLSKGFKFHLNDFSFENSKGKSEMALLVNLTDAQLTEGRSLAEVQGIEEILNLFKQSKLTVKLNRTMAEEAVKQLASLDAEKRERAEQFAKAEIEQLMKAAQESDFAVVNGDDIHSTLELDQGKVKLNGRDVPEEEVQGILFILLMLGLGTM